MSGPVQVLRRIRFGRITSYNVCYTKLLRTLFGALTRLGCDLIDMGVIPDQPDALEAAFADATACADVILTSGGVSVGEADFIKDMMHRLGNVDFWKLNIKPGRPMRNNFV